MNMKVHWFGKTVSERCRYARSEEFAKVFERDRPGLQRLALLLTANSEAAERCLRRAFRECIASSTISKEWVRIWSRRMIIRNAVSLVLEPEDESFINTNEDADHGFVAFSQEVSPGAIAGSESILGLPELDRLVFVICILEHYSMYDCALLLGKPLRDVNEARRRVGGQAGQVGALDDVSQRFSIH
jgi:hypothetical protein